MSRRKKRNRTATVAQHEARPRFSLGALQLAVALALLLVTAWAYAPVLQADFINFDDDDYVYANPAVTAGLSPQGVAWAFTSAHASNYHPLTWIAHMCDVELFGLDAGAHHGVNLLFHLLNVLLLYVLLLRATRQGWCALAVAALWALHPLHVESVAWIAERKDVLSAFFFLLTLLAWVRYAEASRLKKIVFTAVPLACGLLAKPMLVTAPCVLLLLDYWPLQRMERGARDVWRLVREKWTLFLLAGASVALTLWAQGGAGALATLDELPLSARLANVPVAYVTYLVKTFWPSGLGVFYPFAPVPLGATLAAACLLVAVTAVCWLARRKAPYALMGWLWFVGMLAPVVGVIQVGGQAWADRYAYLPHIGLFWALVWGAAAILRRSSRPWTLGLAVSLAVCAPLAWGVRLQAGYWENSETLYRRTLDVTRDNYMIQYNLAVHYRGEKRWKEAVAAYEAALQMRPDYYKALNNLAFLLAAAPRAELRDGPRAVRLAQRALQQGGRGNPALLDTLAAALAAAGRYDAALETATQAVRIARHAKLADMAAEIETRLPYYRRGSAYTLP